MNWVWLIGGTWIAVGIVLAVIIGRSIHLATVTAELPEPACGVAGIVAPRAAGEPGVERRPHPAHRQNSSPIASAALVRGCVPPAARIPSEHEQGVL